MKSVNSYLLKSSPKEVIDFIEMEKSVIENAFNHNDKGGHVFYSMALRHCGEKRRMLVGKYGGFDSDGVML